MNPVHGQEIARREDFSSVQLMRNCILRSISNSSIFDNQRRYNSREEIPNPSIEVKFLEKRCSSFSSPGPQSEETNKKEAKPPEKTEPINLPDFGVSGSFEVSGELFKKNDDKETGEVLANVSGNTEDTPLKLKNSGKNSLKLAIRSKSDGIFEDCSTYNISCLDTSPELKSNEIFTNSLAGSYSNDTDLENLSVTDGSYSDSELAFSSPLTSPDSPDEQTSLCDTFFTHIANNENEQLSKRPSPHLSQANRKISASKQPTGKNSPPSKEEVIKKSEDDSSFNQGGRRDSKKIRRRHRKNHSKDPLVYECPKCGVSYVIASKMTNDGVCFHCDMWTSVEPEFVKREKLLTWNTCRIC